MGGGGGGGGVEFIYKAVHSSTEICKICGVHGCTVLTNSPPTSEVGGSNPEPCGKDGSFISNDQQFKVQNLHQLCVLVSSAHKATHRHMTQTVLKAMLKPK